MKNLRQFVGVPTEEFIKNELLMYEALPLISKDLGLRYIPKLEVKVISLYGSHYNPCSVTISISEFDYQKFHPLFILAHELRHAYQAETGMLSHDLRTMCHLWLNERYPMKPEVKIKHEHLPWERDANRYANEIMRQLENDYRRET